MLLLLILSQTYSQGYTRVTIVNNASGVNLYFLDEAFLDVSRGSGIRGASINPAALGKTRGLCLYLGAGGSKENLFNTSFVLDPGELSDSIVFPLSLGYKETGGLDYLGFAKSFGPFAIGFAYQRGFELGIELHADQTVTQDFEYIYERGFTHEDHDSIPEGDTVYVSIPLSGTATVQGVGSGSVYYREMPFFFGTGFGFGPLNIGLGLKIIRTQLYGDLRFNFMGQIDSVVTYIDTSAVDNSGDTWEIDSLKLHASTVNDTLFYGGLNGNYSGTRFGGQIGMLLDMRFIKLGLVYERTSTLMLSGAYALFYGFPSGAPEFVDIDTSGLDVSLTERRISGEVRFYSGEWPMNSEREEERTAFLLYPVNRFRAGLYFNLIALRISLGANVDLLPENTSAGELYFGASVGLPIPYLDTRFGIAGKILYIRPSPDVYIPTQPNITMGLSTGANINRLTIDLTMRLNLTQGILSAAGQLQDALENQDFHVDPLAALNFGFGIGLKL